GFRGGGRARDGGERDALAGMGAAERRLAGRHIRVLVAGFVPQAKPPTAMNNRRVRALMRSPNPGAEWHSGELETAFMLAAEPELVRRRVARRLAPAWFDFRGALARGARNFCDLGPGGAGYFGLAA